MWEAMRLSTLANCVRAWPGHWKFPVTLATGKPETLGRYASNSQPKLSSQDVLVPVAQSSWPIWKPPSTSTESHCLSLAGLEQSGLYLSAVIAGLCRHAKHMSGWSHLNVINWFDFKIPYLIKVHICLPISIAWSPWILGTCQPLVVNGVLPVWIFFLTFGQETVCVKACLFFNFCLG